MITKETVTKIAFAYREVEIAEALLKQISDAMRIGDTPDLRDAFGRQRGLQLGVPSGENAHRLFDVPWSLARPIIECHLAEQKSLIVALTARAVAEASAWKRSV